MKIKNQFSIFTITFLIAGLFCLAFTGTEATGNGVPQGCCRTEMDGGQCVACDEGAGCFTSEDFCESQDGFFIEGPICLDDGAGANCLDSAIVPGCCVIEPNNCVDDILSGDCFENNPGAEIWVSSVACAEVPQCNVTRNVPTLSNWGLIAMAGLFVLVGIWAITRKKAEA